MIELIKLLLDTAGKLIPMGDLLRQRRSDEIATIGLQLFDLYDDTLRIVEGGFDIINDLSYVVNRHDYYYQTGMKYPEKVIDGVRSLTASVQKQTMLLDALITHYGDDMQTAQIAEAGSEKTMVRFIHTRCRQNDHSSVELGPCSVMEAG